MVALWYRPVIRSTLMCWNPGCASTRKPIRGTGTPGSADTMARSSAVPV